MQIAQTAATPQDRNVVTVPKAEPARGVVDTLLLTLRGGVFEGVSQQLRNGAGNKRTPWYDAIVRPVNRLFGGPTQPLSSSLFSGSVNAYVMHDLLGGCVRAAFLGCMPKLTPEPFFLTTFAMVALAVGLHKVGRFYHEQALQRATRDAVGGKEAAGIELTKLCNLVMRAPRSGKAVDALGAFLKANMKKMVPQIQQLAARLEAKEPAAVNEVAELIRLGQAYELHKTDEAFGDLMGAVQSLTATEISPQDTRKDTMQLLQDAAKALGIGAAYGMMWHAWLTRARPDGLDYKNEVYPGLLAFAGIAVGFYLAPSDVDKNAHRCGQEITTTAAGRRIAKAFSDIEVSALTLAMDKSR